MMNEDQESEMQSIEEKFAEENSLQFISRSQLQYSQRVRRPLCVHVQDTSNYTLTEVTNYVNT